jgi:hypothetical protein
MPPKEIILKILKNFTCIATYWALQKDDFDISHKMRTSVTKDVLQ